SRATSSPATSWTCTSSTNTSRRSIRSACGRIRTSFICTTTFDEVSSLRVGLARDGVQLHEPRDELLERFGSRLIAARALAGSGRGLDEGEGAPREEGVDAAHLGDGASLAAGRRAVYRPANGLRRHLAVAWAFPFVLTPGCPRESEYLFGRERTVRRSH